MNSAKLLGTSFYRTPPDDWFLCLPVILSLPVSFSDHLFCRAPLGNCLFHVQVVEFQPPDTIKSILQALFKHFIRKRDNRSQMFFKIGVLKNFAIFTEKQLCWPLQAFFYRTPTVVASGFSLQQIFFSAESGIYC